MKTKIQIKSVLDKLLFEFEKENNTIKETVVEAYRQGANLREANLQKVDLSGIDLRNTNLRGVNFYGADLSEASFYGADLSEANLSKANFYRANLSETNLREANLYEANLREANLSKANLQRANLRGVNFYRTNLSGAKNKETAKIPMHCKWVMSIQGGILKIGCEEKTFEEWTEWFASNDEFETKRKTEEFNQIEACFLAYKAYYEHLENK